LGRTVKTAVANRLTQLAQPIAARRPAPTGFLGWLGVCPIGSPPSSFRIMAFDLPSHVIEQDLDPVGHQTNESSVVVASLEEVEHEVARLGGDPDELEAPWKVDYPL
jgi:hypothetical protein